MPLVSQGLSMGDCARKTMEVIIACAQIQCIRHCFPYLGLSANVFSGARDRPGGREEAAAVRSWM